MLSVPSHLLTLVKEAAMLQTAWWNGFMCQEMEGDWGLASRQEGTTALSPKVHQELYPTNKHRVSLEANTDSVEPWDDCGPSRHLGCGLAKDPELEDPAEPPLVWPIDHEMINSVVLSQAQPVTVANPLLEGQS